MPRTIRLLLTFYRSIFFPKFVITLICGALFWKNGLSILAVQFWLKLSVTALLFYYFRSYKRKEFYYYQSLGLSQRFLWISTLSFDFCLYLFLMVRVYKLSS